VLVFRDDLFVDGGAAYSNAVRIGYARVSGPTQDHQMQLDALADAGCREVIVETAVSPAPLPACTFAVADRPRDGGYHDMYAELSCQGADRGLR
jgi:hypothetical protein